MPPGELRGPKPEVNVARQPAIGQTHSVSSACRAAEALASALLAAVGVVVRAVGAGDFGVDVEVGDVRGRGMERDTSPARERATVGVGAASCTGGIAASVRCCGWCGVAAVAAYAALMPAAARTAAAGTASL